METKQEPKFKIGDNVRIVNYGHLLFCNKKETPKEWWPKEFYSEDENFGWWDIQKDFVGQETIITDVIESQGRVQYGTKLFSWAGENQLELTTKPL